MTRKVPEVFKTHPRGMCRGEYLPAPFSEVPIIPGIAFSAFPSWIKEELKNIQGEDNNSAGS